MSRRQAAKHFNISRDSVAKMMAYSTPPGYQRQSPIRRPKLDAFVSTIDHWLDEDIKVPRKQRHTAKRVFDRLRDECGFTGGYTIIKDYMRERDQRRQEVFVPLSHPPGHAQADFGEALVVIGGVERKAHFFVLDLPHSDGCYVRAYPAAVSEAWVDGHIHAFAFFGAVPQSIVYDNDRCLVAKILPDGTRKRATLFSGFLSHYLIRDRYGRPGKGNDKGSVEGLVGYARRNFMVPIPQFATWEAFNAWLEEQCRKRQADARRDAGGLVAQDDAGEGAHRAAPGVEGRQAADQVEKQILPQVIEISARQPARGARGAWLRRRPRPAGWPGRVRKSGGAFLGASVIIVDEPRLPNLVCRLVGAPWGLRGSSVGNAMAASRRSRTHARPDRSRERGNRVGRACASQRLFPRAVGFELGTPDAPGQEGISLRSGACFSARSAVDAYVVAKAPSPPATAAATIHHFVERSGQKNGRGGRY